MKNHQITFGKFGQIKSTRICLIIDDMFPHLQGNTVTMEDESEVIIDACSGSAGMFSIINEIQMTKFRQRAKRLDDLNKLISFYKISIYKIERKGYPGINYEFEAILPID